MQYNTAGAVVATLDPLSHGVTISYADSFSDDGNSRNTLAYPTTVTDAAGFSSSMKYNYDFGAATRKQTPLPNVTDNEAGPVQTIEYDSLGRLQKVKNLFNNAYTRYEYPASQNRIDTYTTILDTSTEAHSFKITDGHGRVIASASDHPGSTGGFSGQLIYYDTMGRVIKQSNPTETSASSTSGNPYDWPTAGDDAQAGWVYTQQSYDWKGRPLVTTNTDTTTKSASYDGCGCAGGQVVTLTDEVGRQQKVYGDVLGRQWKSEVLNSDSSVYSTITKTLDTLDHVTLMRQYQGADASTVYQNTTMSYDGYGRLHAKHVPEQQVDTNNSVSTDYTAYTYNTDDTVNSVTDARSALATYSYNNRRLVTGITYSSPSGSGITVPGAVSFGYDAAGNRISMSDGIGSCTYAYDTLSRMSSETHHFNDLASSSTSGNYTLSYGYNVGGELTGITDGFSTQVGYVYDSTGRLTTVTNSGASNFSSQYLSNIEYRAWGARKYVDYGNGVHAQANYNSRLVPTSYSLSNVSKSYPFTDSATLSWTYDYYDDGRVHHASDGDDNKWDRSYAYDHAARISEADTNKRARSQTPDSYHPDPYQQSFGYDAFNHSANRTGYLYSQMLSDSASYTNNRRSGWTYDADGNTTVDSSYTQTFDAAGHNLSAVASRTVGDGSTQWPNQPNLEITQSYDGNGQSLKRNQITRMNDYDPETGQYYGVQEDNQTRYYLRSSVLGGAIINEMLKDSQNNVAKTEGYVYAGGEMIASQTAGQYEHHNAVTGSWITTNASNRYVVRQERDPANGAIPLEKPASQYNYAAANFGGALLFIGGDPSDYSHGYILDGIFVSASFVGGGATELKSVFGTLNSTIPNVTPVWVPDDSKDWTSTDYVNNPDATDPNQQLVGVGTIHDGHGGHFESVMGGSITTFLALRPQKPVVVNGHIIEDPQTPCHIMADVAQNEANDALMQNPNDARAALAQFDKTFSTLYVGGPFTSSYQAYRWRGGDGRTINPNYPFTGGDGFRNEYKDSGHDPNPLIAGPKADQTHHFAAYLSLGVNGVAYATIYGEIREDNQGDLNLSRAAFHMGFNLHNSPSSLRNIGLYIRRSICDGPGHGLYKR
jgi:YD repeat-containing protein